ncbi:MAG: hypothetical protein Q4G46_01540 [Propionibacteriaceae bacterium]|nr:hypothetical protein [Propionibacteriaceae bacterium]
MPAAPSRLPRPGWYADPRGEDPESSGPPTAPEAEDGDRFRWWDGEGWTAWLADSAYAPRPRGAVARIEPVPVLGTPRSPRPFLASLVAVGLIIVLVGISLIGQGMAQPSEPFLRARPPEGEGPARVYQEYELDVIKRQVVIYQRLELPLPPSMKILPGVEKITTVFRKATQAYQPAGGANDAVPIMLIGDAEPELVVPGDAAASSERILRALLLRYEQGGGVTPQRLTTEPWPAVPGAVRMRGWLQYTTPVNGATGDDLVMYVAPWEQGPHSGMGVWVAFVPETESPESRHELLEAEPGIKILD